MKEEAVFYHIYPLGFCGKLYRNDYNVKYESVRKIEEWIPHMKELGVNALYLGPIFQSEYHGYDTVDYYSIDSRLGTEDDFSKLSWSLKENDISIVLDGVFNHVGRDFWAFQDLLRNRENSPYKGWFVGVNFYSNNCYNDNLSYDCWEGHMSLVKLNLKNYYVKEHLFNAVKQWIEKFGIDGLRLDAADCLDIEFIKELSNFAKNTKSNFWIMGEIIHGDYNRWINGGNIDSTTNYECYKGLYSSFNDKNYFEIAHSLSRQFGSGGMYQGKKLYNFVDNHDVNRIASTLKDKRDLYSLYIMLFTIPGIPSIYYGSEWELEGMKDWNSDNSLRPELNIGNFLHNKDLKDTISKLSYIRKSEKSLVQGSYRQIFVKSEQFAFERDFFGDKIVVLVNQNGNEANVILNNVAEGNYFDVLNGNERFDIKNGSNINIYSKWGRILKKV